MNPKIVFMKKNICPFCNYQTDRAKNLEDETAVPDPGDISLCIRCAEASEFDENLNLVKFDLNKLELEDAREINIKQTLIKDANRIKND